MSSKKKVSGGNTTMTLRDFHGGSIPSDLPLPSAPSLTAKPSSDRSSGYDRAPSWGNRSRPLTSPSTKNFDGDKTPFLTTHGSAHIGRNFDEDERKPLDSPLSAPRRTVRDETLQLQGTSRLTAWSAPNAVSKLVHSNALDHKVPSSATWHSSKIGVVSNGEKEHFDGVLARHAERGLAIIDDHGDGGRRKNEFVDSKQSFGKLGGVGGSESQHPVPSEPIERPKLKFLPRTKAMESSELSVRDSVQVHGQANPVKLVSDGTGSGKEAGYRPKLNLKPRLQPLEQLEGKTESDRNALFGGARPRELVLKERGVDDIGINNFDVVEHLTRTENTTARAEKLPHHSHQTRYGEKNECALNDRRTDKKLERKEQNVDVDRVNAQGRNWRSDNRRNAQEADRKQLPERQPSPETWRKPAEQPKPAPGAASTTSHSKAASAVELAQAFSRSVSDPKVNDRFSRLAGPATPTSPRPHINGY